MGNIKIVRGVFDTKLELEHAGVAAGFPLKKSPRVRIQKRLATIST